LDQGLSVLSETAACRTLGEGVTLLEAAERSAGVYMFAENYPYMPLTQEMRHRYRAGDIGPESLERARRGRGWAALVVVRLDSGTAFKSLHGFLEAGQQSWVRIHGDNGLMENLRHGDTRPGRLLRGRAVHHRHPGHAFQPGRKVPTEVPDLRRPGVRRAHAGDDWFPDLPDL
jgi:hypothetical protein